MLKNMALVTLKKVIKVKKLSIDSIYEYGQKDDIIGDLKKQLSLAKTSLSAAAMSYEQSYKDQVETLEAAKAIKNYLNIEII